MEIKKIIKESFKLGLILIFLYIAFFSIQGFWNGFHQLDLCFNFINQGIKFDVDTNGVSHELTQGYIDGLNMMKNNFIWMCIDCLLGVLIGFVYRGKNGD